VASRRARTRAGTALRVGVVVAARLLAAPWWGPCCRARRGGDRAGLDPSRRLPRDHRRVHGARVSSPACDVRRRILTNLVISAARRGCHVRDSACSRKRSGVWRCERAVAAVVVARPRTGGVRSGRGGQLPPGFTAQVYVTGEGASTLSAGEWICCLPSVSTLARRRRREPLSRRGHGRRYCGGEGATSGRLPHSRRRARAHPADRAALLPRPPLLNARWLRSARRGAVRHDVRTATQDPGAPTGCSRGAADLFAGGTPGRRRAAGPDPPEGAAADAAGNVYVPIAPGVSSRSSTARARARSAVRRGQRPRLLAAARAITSGSPATARPTRPAAGDRRDPCASVPGRRAHPAGPVPAAIAASRRDGCRRRPARGAALVSTPDGKRLDLASSPTATRPAASRSRRSRRKTRRRARAAISSSS